MTTARRGNLFVISAPSGSGKTTLVRRLLDTLDDVKFSVSFTTRPVRGSERDRIDYHFVPSDLFRTKIEDGEFLEWAEVHGNYYGTSKIVTEQVRASGEDILLDVDVQGAAQVRKAQPDAITLFVMPPSFDVLEERTPRAASGFGRGDRRKAGRSSPRDSSLQRLRLRAHQ